MTFKNWAKKWLDCYKKGAVKQSTYKESYERTVYSYLIPYFGEKKINSINPMELRKFFVMQSNKYHLTTLKKNEAVLKRNI